MAAPASAPAATAAMLAAGHPRPISSMAAKSASHPGAKTRASARCETSDTHSQRMAPAESAQSV